MGGWGCPHEADGQCQHVPGNACDPGMKGCVLYGRVRFSVPEKNSPRIRRQIEREHAEREARAVPEKTGT